MTTRERILAATAEVLGRRGRTKLSLSEVALQAGVSRPTLYRWFSSKRELIDAFTVWERQTYERGVAAAMAGLRGRERLDAALRFVVDYQRSYPGLRMVDVESALVIGRLSRVIPLMREQLERLLPGPTVQQRRRRPCASPSRTTWCAATTMPSSWCSCVTQSGCGTELLALAPPAAEPARRRGALRRPDRPGPAGSAAKCHWRSTRTVGRR